METEKIYSKGQSAEWSKAPSTEDIISIVTEEEKRDKVIELKKDGKGVCYVYTHTVNTTNEKNEDYDIRAWSLSQADILQGASVQEFLVRENERVIFHRVGVIRNGIFVDKYPDSNIRLFDDEKSSGRGSILKTQKLNCVINDLHLGDIFIFEFTKEMQFDDRNILDKSYFRYIHNMPSGYWFYSNFSFRLIQQREQPVIVRKKYFRNDTGELAVEPDQKISKGGEFTFEKSDYFAESKENVFVPYLELATDASWQEIGTYLHALYGDVLEKDLLKEADVIAAIKLDEVATPDEKIERIIDYVQNQIIYLYDADIMHGYVPEHAERTFETKAGDCKAKSVLLMRLLAMVGVESTFVLVNFNADRYIGRSLPSPFIFNHAIIKVTYGGKEYFVDPTWINSAGLIDYRPQPFFGTYLPIDGVSDLSHVDEKAPSQFNIEENTLVTIKSGIGKMEMTAIYRRDSADIVRKNFRTSDREQLLKQQNDTIKARLQYPAEKLNSEIFKDEVYKIISDDPGKNELTVFYSATIMDAYYKKKGETIFRYYYLSTNADYILNFRHKDAVLESFISFPAKYTLKVTSNRSLMNVNNTGKKNLEINNDYFHFSNTKKAWFRTAEVMSEFKPKNYNVIKGEDIEKVKADIREIKNSNFGFGIIYVPTWIYLAIGFFILMVLLGFGIPLLK